MRMTIHLVSREDFWPFALATRAARRAAVLRARPEPTTRGDGGRGADGARAGSRAARAAAQGARRARRPGARAGVGQWVDLVRAPPSGTWERRRADRFALAEDRVGPPPRPVGAGGRRAPRRALPGRVRPGVAQGRRELHRPRLRPARPHPGAAWTSCACAASRARTCSTCRAASLPGRGRARPAALPAHVGRDAARPRPPHGRPARGAPADACSARGRRPSFPSFLRRRRRGGHVALRGAARCGSSRSRRCAARRGVRWRTRRSRLAAFHA